MWKKNLDTGKWESQVEFLTKDNYEFYKQELSAVRLYSKCLSGSTYLTINNLDNLYPQLGINRVGFHYNSTPPSSIPLRGTPIPIPNFRREFYDKYLKEDAFSVKNLFTPERILNDQGGNFYYVDVATTESISFTQSANLTIDGVVLKSGQRVLVKDQVTVAALDPLLLTYNPDNYFRNVITVSNYYFLNKDSRDNYYYYNNQNGIYKYDGLSLIREDDLSNYNKSFKYSVYVQNGASNIGKEFHLERSLYGYYPTDDYNVEFKERKNWVLRNRVDYNNIYEVNYYDAINHPTQSIYFAPHSRTYSIPQRTISVGEFGTIVTNQDRLKTPATYSISNTILNKYKTNLNSIANTEKYYWICGDEGHLLKVDKVDFSIEKIELDTEHPLTSISFFREQFAWVVGKYNTIFYTRDFGINWYRLHIPSFEKYSFNRVVHYDENRTYVGGEAGVFIEFLFTDGTWQSYDRVVSKQLSEEDEYILNEDITDLKKTAWTKIDDFDYSAGVANPTQFDETFTFAHTLLDDYRNLKIDLSIDFQSTRTYQLYIAASFSNQAGFKRTNVGWGKATSYTGGATDWDFYYHTESPSFGEQLNFILELPINSEGNVVPGKYSIDLDIRYDLDIVSDIIVPFQRTVRKYQFEAYDNELLLISSNNSNVICYDIGGKFRPSVNNFTYLKTSQQLMDVKSVERAKDGRDIFIAASKIYKFDILEFLKVGTENSFNNEAIASVTEYEDTYANRLISSTNSMFVVGNNGLNNFINLQTLDPSNKLDPTFDSRLKSRFLILDYDVASKLNFFTDDGDYRLPQVVDIPQTNFTVAGATVSITSIAGERSWLDYYKDTEKTFKYLSSIDDANMVQFSSRFTLKTSLANQVIASSKVGITQSNFRHVNNNNLLTPHLFSPTSSRFELNSRTIAPTFNFNYELLLSRDIGVVIRAFSTIALSNNNTTEIGDVLYISSKYINTSVVVNRIEYYTGPSTGSPITLTKLSTKPTTLVAGLSLYEFYFFYVNFSREVTVDLTKSDANVSILNLNKYRDLNDFFAKVGLHPISTSYGFTISSTNIQMFSKFNPKTAYYNQQVNLRVGSDATFTSKNAKYTDSFLNFGYSPTYNILDYLNKINPQAFTSSKVFTVMPNLTIDGNNGNTWLKNQIFIDANAQTPTNKLVFGEDLRNEWESLLKYTFVDIVTTGSTNYTLLQNLILDKYEESVVYGLNPGTAYIVEFDKILPIKANTSQVQINSRRTLSQISTDLQLLNNIQRSEKNKSLITGKTFKDLQSMFVNKFPTDTYMKVLASDFDIKQNVSAILYTDYNFELAMNVLNVDSEYKYNISEVSNATVNGLTNRLRLKPRQISVTQSVNIGDMVHLQFDDGANSTLSGYQTVISVTDQYIFTSRFYNNSPALTVGTISIYRKDPFFNYQPIDLFKAGIDKQVARSVEILPQNFTQNSGVYSVVNLDLNKYKFEFLDGLSLQEVYRNHHWMLEAEVKNARVGRNNDTNELIWYSGTWRCGRWFGGTWVSGEWLSGDWYSGVWNSLPVKNDKIFNSFLSDEQDPKYSKWYGGRWFDGTWMGGTWYGGRRYAGDWNSGIWYNGIWNDGNWNDGQFSGGIWVQGNWKTGIFNCDSKPAYWLYGTFRSGDFENGMWYNGVFGNDQRLPTRFGTKSTNSRTSTWHSGVWIDGEFHSHLNMDTTNNTPMVSEVHKYSIWRTGVWNRGDWYGGIALNIDFRSGVWHGGISEEIQVVGIDAVNPVNSTNRIYLNGIYKFNPGDEIWIIDDDRGRTFSVLGTNQLPRQYRINQIVEDTDNEITGLYLNYKLSSLNVPGAAGNETYSVFYDNLGDLGVRVVSKFKDSRWKSGIWYNGIFDGGQFDSGIWYNGVFDGNWGS